MFGPWYCSVAPSRAEKGHTPSRVESGASGPCFGEWTCRYLGGLAGVAAGWRLSAGRGGPGRGMKGQLRPGVGVGEGRGEDTGGEALLRFSQKRG